MTANTTTPGHTIRPGVVKGVLPMAGQQHDQYSTRGTDPGDALTDREWRGAGCGETCRRVRVLIIGQVFSRYVVLHDPLTHEEYGMSLSPGPQRGQVVRTGGLVIDPTRATVLVNGRDIHLGPLEIRTVLYLAEHLDAAVPVGDIVAAVWGRDDPVDRVPKNGIFAFLRSHMSRVRRRLHPCGDLFLSCSGVGYRLVARPATDTYRIDAPTPRWSRFYTVCEDCGTTDYAYASHGRCTGCIWRHKPAQDRS
jgi:DNA-binding winged helix-turn-helix (wHTH) protein